MKRATRSVTTILAFWVSAFCMGGNVFGASTWTQSGSPGSYYSSSSTESAPRRSSSRESSKALVPFGPESNNLALDLGQVFLLGNLGTNYQDSLGMQLHYTYGVSDLFGFDSSLGYSSHSDGKYSLTTLLTGLRANLSWYDRVIPYAVVGLGFYKPSYRITSKDLPSSNVSPVVFGVHLGPGIDLQLSQNLFFGAALTFHDIFGTTATVADNTKMEVDGTYTTFFIHAGFTF